jgi:disulfide bond formation protein DsbB
MALAHSGARRWLLVMAGVCLAAVLSALVSQYVFDMQPCPWCILQRLTFVAIGLLCLIAALWGAPAARGVLTGAALVLAGLGVATGVYQHTVASKSQSCNLTLADRIITGLRADALAPWLFEVKASCADAAVKMLGVPYEFWAMALFVLLGLAALRVLTLARR